MSSTRTIPPRQVLVPNSNRRRARLYIYRILPLLPLGAQLGQFPNVQLHARRLGIVLTYALGFWVISARRWFVGPIKQIAGAPPALCCMYVNCVSVDDKRSGCTEEEMGHRCCGASGDVREIGVQRSLDGLLEQLIVERQEGRRTNPWREWDSEHKQEGVRRCCL
jgi:hypothetical protein